MLFVTAAAVACTYLINTRLQGSALTTQDQRHTLRILTWNIGKLYHARWDSRASDDDLDHVAEVIRETDVHVVALQELKGPTQLGRLASMLGGSWRSHVPEDVYDRRAGLLTRLPVEFVRLPTSSGRVAQGAVVTTPGGAKFAVSSVHLDAFDAERRLAQAEEILAGIQRLDVPDFVVAGDFNFDASVAAQDSADQRLYQLLTREMADAGRRAGVTSLISRRLDYVFYHSARVDTATAQVLKERRINIMDHDPLVVELALSR
jgi:endonuclease/exonuclease/phosphatase family metal-dependent hydrolase